MKNLKSIRQCIICKKKFTIKKNAYNQKICGKKKCREINKKNKLRKWRNNNENYFEDYYYVLDNNKPKNIRNISKNKKSYLKEWRKKNSEKWKNYMKLYMREIRNKKKLEA